MEDSLDLRYQALVILNNERKKRFLVFTLELPKEKEAEFQQIEASVKFDTLPLDALTRTKAWEDLEAIIGNEEPITGIGDMAMETDSEEEFIPGTPVGGRITPQRRRKREARHKWCTFLGTGEGDIPSQSKTLTPLGSPDQFPPWERPQLLPVPEHPPSSSRPADLTSKYAEMLGEVGKLEPKEWHVWAKSRPDLCETAPYFRQNQSGIHIDTHTRMIGYLL